MAGLATAAPMNSSGAGGPGPVDAAAGALALDRPRRPGSAGLAQFDLVEYSARYAGQTKVRRLAFLAEKHPQLADQALTLVRLPGLARRPGRGQAVAEIKRGQNTQQYQQLVEAHRTRLETLGAGRPVPGLSRRRAVG